jgi:hypothetical protein
MIIKISDSPLKNKRFRVLMDNGKKYDFGLKGGSTYIDHTDIATREAYRKRHLGNATEKRLIENLVPSPALFSYWLLWGKYTDLGKNIQYLNNLWKQKQGYI